MKNIIFLYFTPQSITSINLFKNLTPNNSGVWKDIRIIDKPEDADYYVIFEDMYTNFKYPIDFSRTIYFQSEPQYVRKVKAHRRKIGKADHLQFIYLRDDIEFLKEYTYENNRHPCFWVSAIPFNDMVKYPYHKKNKNLSCLMGNTGVLPEHNLRLNFLKEYAKMYPNDIEIYGYEMPTKGPYKGELKEKKNVSFNRSHRSSVEAYSGYNYSLVCEGYKEPGQTCNKLYDCILNWCMPIYYGNPRIFDFMPRDSLYTIDIERDPLKKLTGLSSRKISEKNIMALKEARDLILYKHNVLEIVYQTLKGQ